MDKGTRNYAIILGLFVIGITWLLLYEDPNASALNDLLEANQEIAEFPYEFKVVSVKDGRAIVTTPRSTVVPVEQVLGQLFPRVKGKAPESKEFQQAQAELARIQKMVAATILKAPDIDHIQWQLDRDWLMQQGIVIN